MADSVEFLLKFPIFKKKFQLEKYISRELMPLYMSSYDSSNGISQTIHLNNEIC